VAATIACNQKTDAGRLMGRPGTVLQKRERGADGQGFYLSPVHRRDFFAKLVIQLSDMVLHGAAKAFSPGKRPPFFLGWTKGTSLSDRQALRKAGILSKNFWLRNL
jgi:hypothetical protein